MKKSKFIKLFSAMLCIVMLFVSCDNTDNTPPAEPTPLTFNDVFANDFESDKVVLTSAEKIELGEKIDERDFLAIFMETKPDSLGKTATVFNVFNYYASKNVLTLESTYDPAIQAEYDADEDLPAPVNYPIPEIVSDDGIIAVTTYSAQKPTDEQIKAYTESFSKAMQDPAYLILMEAELSKLYLYVATVDYYDAMGNKITTYKSQPMTADDIDNIDASDFVIDLPVTIDGAQYKIHDKIVTLKKDGSAVKVEDSFGNIIHNYDAVNGKYGYYLNAYSAAAYSNPLAAAIQVYDTETGELVLQHNIDFDFTDSDFNAMLGGNNDPVAAYVLDNGNVYVSVLIPLTDDAEEYDFILPMPNDDDEQKYRVDSYILDVTTGETKAVEITDAVIKYLYSYTDMKKDAELEDRKPMFTDKATNIAITVGIYNKTLNTANPKLVVLDNDMNVIYTLDLSSLAYEADVSEDSYGFSFLSTGDLMIELAENTAADYAIVKTDGTIRCYVPKNATVGDGFIYKNGVIYDYDLKVLCDLETKGFNFTDADAPIDDVDILGDAFIVTDNYKHLISSGPSSDPDDDITEILTRFYLVKAEGSSYTKTEIFESESRIVEVDSNRYIITYSEDNEKYTLYNINLEKIIVSENGIIIPHYDSVIYASTAKDNKNVIYLLK